MGEGDISHINPIYNYCNEITKENGWPFQFKEDSGGKETAIQIIGTTGMSLIPPQEALARGFGAKIWVPDILDWSNKIIIEYEEEAKPNRGAKRRKGHLEVNNHDVERDTYYTKIANPPFKLYKVWESDKDWKKGVKKFLEDCYKEIQQQ